MVSVPLRGEVVSNDRIEQMKACTHSYVSVPLRGEVVSNPVSETPCPTGALKPVCGGRLIPDIVPDFISYRILNKRQDFGCG